MLHTELPLLVVRRHAAGIHERKRVPDLRVQSRGAARRHVEAVREGIGERGERRGSGIDCPHVRSARIECADLPQETRVFNLARIEQPVAAAQYRSRQNAPGEAEAWGEVIRVQIALTPGHAIHAGEHSTAAQIHTRYFGRYWRRE